MLFPRQECPKMSKTAKMSVFMIADGRDEVWASNQSQIQTSLLVDLPLCSLDGQELGAVRGRGQSQRVNE